MTHSFYFLGYAVFITFCLLVIIWAQYSRYRNEGTPFNFTILKIIAGVALMMWTGAFQTIYFYDTTPLTAAWAAFFLGITLTSFVVWEGSRLLNKIQDDEKLIRKLSTRDSLTGLWNLRILHETLKAELSRSSETHEPLSLVLFRINNLEKINKEYDYERGDIILRELCRRLSESLRKDDRICRYKSATFALILPHTSKEEAIRIATGLWGIFLASFDIDGKSSPTIHSSVGIATNIDCECSRKEGEAADDILIGCATNALTTAQEHGGNCIFVHENDGCREV